MNPNTNIDSPSLEEISVNLDKLAAIQQSKTTRKYNLPFSLNTVLIAGMLVSLILVLVMGGLLLSNATSARYEVKFVSPNGTTSNNSEQTEQIIEQQENVTQPEDATLQTINLPLYLSFTANPTLNSNSLPSSLNLLQKVNVDDLDVGALVLVPFIATSQDVQNYFNLIANQSDVILNSSILQSAVPSTIQATITNNELNIVTGDLTSAQAKSLFYIGNFFKDEVLTNINLVKLNGSEVEFSALELN